MKARNSDLIKIVIKLNKFKLMLIVQKIVIPFITVSTELVTYDSSYKIKLMSVTQQCLSRGKFPNAFFSQ